jgi:hypothetical protein
MYRCVISLVSVELKSRLLPQYLSVKLLNVGGTGVLTADPSHWLVLYATDEEV